MGFDIGASKLTTITPMFSYSFLVDNNWKNLTESIYIDNNEIIGEVPNPDLNNTNLGEFSFGIRLLFRLDNFYKYTRRSYR